MRSLWLRKLLSDKLSLISLALLAVVLLMAISAPILYPDGPWVTVARPMLPPMSQGLLLGTDAVGRDIMAGIVHGSRVSLLVGFVATALPFVFGLTVGAAAGFFGGLADDALMRFTEVFQAIPHFLLALLLVSILSPGIWSIIIAIAIVSWPPVARLVRSEFKSIREREYVQAARISGQHPFKIVVSEILPNALPPILVMGSLMTATAILLEAAISFIGLGDPNLMSWGYMVGSGRVAIRSAWWISVAPGVVIFFTVLAINFVGEGLNDALNPRSQKKSRN